MRDYDYYREIFDGREMPLGFVDLDALENNIEKVRARAKNTNVRVASKSVRCPAVLERILDADEGFEGIMCYSGHEAKFLAEKGFDDLLVAYPVWHENEISAVCEIDEDAEVWLMVDSEEHVEKLDQVAGSQDTNLKVCIDLDMSSKFLGIHFGVMRSGIRGVDDAVEVAAAIDGASNLELDALMGYEAQIAGLTDRNPANNPGVNAVIRFLKRRSAGEVIDRRERVVGALEDEGYSLSVVNGGGTGSVETTIDDESVTEVTVGSGFYAPKLFDYYDDFQHEPAAGYAIKVTRQPEDDIYTCRGGGYTASGPAGEDKAPELHLPENAELLSNEGAGEVQTPVRYDGGIELSFGDPIVMRHSKAGELCRNFESLLLVKDGEVVDEVPTYRGEGKCFL